MNDNILGETFGGPMVTVARVQSDIGNGKTTAADGDPLIGMASDLVRFLMRRTPG